MYFIIESKCKILKLNEKINKIQSGFSNILFITVIIVEQKYFLYSSLKNPYGTIILNEQKNNYRSKKNAMAQFKICLFLNILMNVFY